MPIPSSINDLSTTAGSNSPAGSESPSTIDDYLRTYASYIALLRDQNQTTPQTIAAAALTDIGAATSNIIFISGAATVTSLGTAAAGVTRTLRFAGSLILTHNATSLILPGGFNITTFVNDTAEFQSLGSGNWICTKYSVFSVKPGVIVGNVTQSGGAVTGAIIERGSNGNGEYVRFADGTQICTRNRSYSLVIGDFTAYGNIWYYFGSWTFPAVFAVAPAIAGDVRGVGRVNSLSGDPNTTTSACNFFVIDYLTPAGISVVEKVFAIGRWF